MKQLLSLALALLPCLAWAQYPSNGNQKITLGEQTTADGLIWRGVASDTTKTIKTDTSAWIVLDTASSIMYHYDSSSVGRKWLRLNLLPSDTSSLAYVNTYGTQTVNGAKTFNNTVTATRFDPTSSSASGTGMFLPATKTIGFSINGSETFRLDSLGNANLGGPLLAYNPNLRSFQMLNSSFYGFQNRLNLSANEYPKPDGKNYYINSDFATLYIQMNGQHRFYIAPSGTAGNEITFTQAMTLDADGDLGIATASPTEKLHVVGNARITGLANASNPVNVQVDVNGVLIRTSSIKLKDDVQNLPYGLNEIMLLRPSKFNYKDKYKFGEGYDIGFIAEDVNDVIPEAVGTGVESDIFMDSVKLIPILTKAIQEQQALIKALEQRIINLENK